MGNRIYGCDDCLAVCPWNKFAAAAAANRAFAARAELAAPAVADLLALDDAGFRQVFAGSPIKRIGRDRMVRNALIAAGNGGDAGLVPRVTRAARRSGAGGARGGGVGARAARCGGVRGRERAAGGRMRGVRTSGRIDRPRARSRIHRGTLVRISQDDVDGPTAPPPAG